MFESQFALTCKSKVECLNCGKGNGHHTQEIQSMYALRNVKAKFIVSVLVTNATINISRHALFATVTIFSMLYYSN